MDKLRYSILSVFLVISMLFSVSCSSSGKDGSSGAPNQTDSGSKAVLDNQRAVEQTVTANAGGQISLDTAEGDRVKIAFPQGSLAKDVTLAAAPMSKAPLESKDLLIKGFSLEEKGTGKGPALKFPALIIFTAKGVLPEDSTIVKYRESEDGFDAVPTKIKTINGKSTLIAQVTGFSKYGVARDSGGKGSDSNGSQAGSQAFDLKNFNWVIYVDDKASYTYNNIKSTVRLKLRAVNVSGGIEGEYTGTAQGTTKFDGQVAGGNLNTTSNVQNGRVNIKLSMAEPLAPLEEEDPLAPLVEPAPEPLAPLVDSKPGVWDFYGQGTVTMTDSHAGTLSKGGLTVSGKLPSRTTSMYVEVSGTQVTIKQMSPSGPLVFKGFIRGEGK